ncbi:MAG TPA: hypothetical protein VNT42_00535 [Sphingomonas sp.]|nr:hypothetical protein [Sphingomonas sp.]
MRIIPILSASLAILSLASCGTSISAPSLDQRPVEKQPISMPETDPREAETPADAALISRIAAIVAAAETGDKAFASQRARAEEAVARATGAAPGSDAWIAAQEALTALESARGPARDAAADVDALRQDSASAAPGNRAAIDNAAARVGQIDRAQRAAIAALAGRLS